MGMETLLAVNSLPANMDEKQSLFAVWLATPKKERRPKTQKELAEVLQVDQDTLCNWKHLSGFLEVVEKISRRRMFEALPEIYETITREALKGNPQLIDRALELTGVWSRKQSVNHEHKFIFEDLLSEIIEGEEVENF